MHSVNVAAVWSQEQNMAATTLLRIGTMKAIDRGGTVIVLCLILGLGSAWAAPGSGESNLFTIDNRLFTLAISVSRGGTVGALGEGSHDYYAGTAVPVSAHPAANCRFLYWTGSAVDANQVADPCASETSVVIRGDYTLRAQFLSLSGRLFVDDDAVHDPGPYDNTISDPDEDGTPTHPFDSIQEAVEVADVNATVLVDAGTYVETVRFTGRDIALTSEDPDHPGCLRFPTIDANDTGTVVTFDCNETEASLLKGFVLTRGRGPLAGAVLCDGSRPTIQNCLIAGNRSLDPHGAALVFIDSNSVIDNCTIANNYGGIEGSGLRLISSDPVIANSIIWGNVGVDVVADDHSSPVICYTNTTIPQPGEGNLAVDPRFSMTGFWGDIHDLGSAVDPNAPNTMWVPGDYHLRSESGRWNPERMGWMIDLDTSVCIDAGDPDALWGTEMNLHGERRNMGAYGATQQASLTHEPMETTLVSISEPAFNGQMSEYETTNAQYCQYLNAALADGTITVYNSVVYAAADASRALPYLKTHTASHDSQILYAEGTFSVRHRDNHSMTHHPVVMVSWYGARAFCDYYGYRLPEEKEWLAVADYDGSYEYGCGPDINQDKANYREDGHSANPLGLLGEPYTSPVGHYPAYGYGMYDMAGNAWEWTNSPDGNSFIFCGGSWNYDENTCRTSSSAHGYDRPYTTYGDIGFRVCR